MIANVALATAQVEERTRRALERHRIHANAEAQLHMVRKALGRLLESIGRRLQQPAHSAGI